MRCFSAKVATLITTWGILLLPSVYSDNTDLTKPISPTVDSYSKHISHQKARKPQYAAAMCQRASVAEKEVDGYKWALAKALLQEWTLSPIASQSPVFRIAISKDGQLLNIDLKKSSQNPELDNRAEEMIRRFPYKPLPKSYWADQLTQFVAYDTLKETISDTHPYYGGKEVVDWLNKVVIRSRKNWRPPVLSESRSTTTLLYIDTTNGQILGTAIWSSSCDPGMDQSVLQAIEKSAPCPKPKFDYPLSFITVQVTHDYEFSAH